MPPLPGSILKTNPIFSTLWYPLHLWSLPVIESHPKHDPTKKIRQTSRIRWSIKALILRFIFITNLVLFFSALFKTGYDSWLFSLWKHTSGFGWFCNWKSGISFLARISVRPQQSVSGSRKLVETTKYRCLE